MRVHALLSHYAEHPDHLRRCVESLAGIADHLIAVDGAYASFPDATASTPDAAAVFGHACVDAGIELTLCAPQNPWMGGEVEKRAFMFAAALERAQPLEDWFLIIDGDMAVGECNRDSLRLALSATMHDVAEVRWRDVRPDGHFMSDLHFRSFFRALPGLTVKWTHYLYVAPAEVGWRYLWHTPNGRPSPEPVLDLTQHITLHHHNLDRSGERAARARTYYQDRDARQLERAPHVW